MSSALIKDITLRHGEVLDRIARAASRVKRGPDEITLVAVTKTWPAGVVSAAYRAGIRHVGENRAEEMARKRTEVSAMLPDVHDLTWHQIGTLQSRKTKLVAEHADLFHALDRLKIARRLAQQLDDLGRTLPVLVEVNLSGESSKSGFLVSRWEENATQRESLRNVIETITQLPGFNLQGLMTMAPWDAPEETIRATFRRTRSLAEWLQSEVPRAALPQLSMGMSDDFEIAVEEGATIVRVGRAIFGSRR
ncbi:MAG: YggS family pyridoxal phosphate-dependent enzyme [Chloroflexi bacterium]|jgi:pyridoxal phosphate enzyme (YggS family)|nr:YggS family pyridoxal phosphate-dependent enzyme [Chloroflexota bacterium]